MSRLSSAQRRNLAMLGAHLQPGQPMSPGFYWVQRAHVRALQRVQVYTNPGGFMGYPNPSGLWLYLADPSGQTDGDVDAPLDHCSVTSYAPAPGPRYVCSGAYVGRHPGGQPTAMCWFTCESEEDAWRHFEHTSHAVDEACLSCDPPAWHYAIPA